MALERGGWVEMTHLETISRGCVSVVELITNSLEVLPSFRSLRISGRQGAQLSLVGSNWHPTPVIITNITNMLQFQPAKQKPLGKIGFLYFLPSVHVLQEEVALDFAARGRHSHNLLPFPCKGRKFSAKSQPGSQYIF